MKTMPDGLRNLGAVMSNINRKILPDAEEEIRSGWYSGRYPAKHFFGKIWFDGQHLQCQIMQAGRHLDTIQADSLQEIMDHASEKYGEE